MDTKNKRENSVRLEPETKKEIEKSIAEMSPLEIQLVECDGQIVVLEKKGIRIKKALEQIELSDEQIAKLEEEKEENDASLTKYYALREELEKKRKAEENK